MSRQTTRRQFLSRTAASLASARLMVGSPCIARTQLDPIRVGYVGTGIRFHSELGRGFTEFGPCLAVCDVDSRQRERAFELIQEQHEKHEYSETTELCEDYRRVLDNPGIGVVVIATPDHWHTKIAIEAMQAGKDVYCEKPMTLTIREGQQLLEVLKSTKRVLQVGTQQRTEYNRMFAQAVGMVRDGKIGDVRRITCAIGGAPTSPALSKADPPQELNWERWLGPAPLTDYRLGDIIHTEGWGKGFPLSRTHRYFRWWYEYSGGKTTDWGAHHVDIVMWALDKLGGPIGKVTLTPNHVEHPVPLVDGMPTRADQFNTATHFNVGIRFADGVELVVCDSAEDLGFTNGILFEGDTGRFFVNRGKLTGKPIEDLADQPLRENWADALYGTAAPPSHIRNFVDCIGTRATPISDAQSHHRMLSICHSLNIAMRLGRPVTLDTQSETFVGDDGAADEGANQFIARGQREGYEIIV